MTMQQISNEWNYVIHLVRCALHGLPPQELPEGLQFAQVFQCAQDHQVANIAFCALDKLKNKPQPELYHRWRISWEHAVTMDITQSYAAQEIREVFGKNKIRWVEAQGTRIKPLYPQPDYRTMSDIDFIIHEENIPKAQDILETLGYECETAYCVELNAHRHPNTHIELHTEYFLEDCPYRKVLHSPFDVAGEPEDVFYLYNLLHIAKHYFGSGCGIRRVLDVYFLNQKYPHCSQSAYVREALQRAGLTDFVSELSSLANVWFSREAQDFPKSKMVYSVLNSGVHGSCFIAQQNHLEQTVRVSGRWSRVKYCLGRLLGTGKDLITRYPVLNRWKILFPFCWLHRAFCAISPKQLRRTRREVQIIRHMKSAE